MSFKFGSQPYLVTPYFSTSHAGGRNFASGARELIFVMLYHMTYMQTIAMSWGNGWPGDNVSYLPGMRLLILDDLTRGLHSWIRVVGCIMCYYRWTKKKS